MKEYSEPAKIIKEALSSLKTMDAPAATANMWNAKESLAGTPSLFSVIRMLHGLPQVEITVRTDRLLKDWWKFSHWQLIRKFSSG